LRKLGILILTLGCLLLPSLVSATATVAVFPLQELGEGRNDANLPLTRILAERLTEIGNEIIGMEAVIAFMADNRIRAVGHLDTFNISRTRRDLGAAFVLLGTISQRKEKPEPTIGLTLNLVRTSDARTIWTFAGSLGTGEQRRLLGIGEPQATAQLQPLLFDRVMAQWPWRIIKEEQQIGSISIDTVSLEPAYVRPGDEVRSRVRLRDSWTAGQAPQVFFKVEDQLYPARISADGHTYEGSWLAGERNGRVSVNLLLEWPHYGRTVTSLLGTYIVDGTLPLFELELGETVLLDGKPAFRGKLVIIPRMLVRKALSHWRLAFYDENGLVGDMDGTGNPPEGFTWYARDMNGPMEDGDYEVVFEVWDQAGNTARDSQRVELSRSLPQVDLEVVRNGEGMTVDLEHTGRVPLAFWQMEMWTREGKILTYAEGKELPAKIGVTLPSEQEEDIQGFLLLQDVLGNRIRHKLGDMLPRIAMQAKARQEAEEKKPTGVSEKWVEEF
jgi:hypothetical protein